MNMHALCTTLFLSTLTGTALADEVPTSPTATTEVKIDSDWSGTELIRNVGTSYGTGYVAGRVATVVVSHVERICRLPCTSQLATEGNYYVQAPGMNARAFEIPVGSKSLDLSVRGASNAPIVLSSVGVTLGGTAALLGGILWGVLGSKPGRDTTAL